MENESDSEKQSQDVKSLNCDITFINDKILELIKEEHLGIIGFSYYTYKFDKHCIPLIIKVEVESELSRRRKVA